MPRKKKEVVTTGPYGEPLLVEEGKFKVEVEKPKKILKKKVKKEKKLSMHVFYVRSDKTMLDRIKAMSVTYKTSINEIAKTIIADFFTAPKDFFDMKKGLLK